MTENSNSIFDLNIFYKKKKIANTHNTKFLGLTLDNTFSWKVHIESVVPKLSSACYAVRMVKALVSGNIEDGVLLLLSLDHDL
jgi:hypothetical protein